MRILISEDPNGSTAYLTDESAASRYGCPVLEVNAEDVDGAFGPSDLIGDVDVPEDLITAAEIVAGWATQDGRTEEELDAARRFLAQWPTGPQV